MQLAEKHVLSEVEYLAFEEKAPLRHEYVGGEAYAMPGGALRHNRITANTLFVLMSNLKGKPCQVFMNDVKLRVDRDSAYYYPDVMVTCSEQPSAANESQVVNDPVLVVEVLSPSTAQTAVRSCTPTGTYLRCRNTPSSARTPSRWRSTVARATLDGCTLPMSLVIAWNSQASACP